jgi:hypothetical protein
MSSSQHLVASVLNPKSRPNILQRLAISAILSLSLCASSLALAAPDDDLGRLFRTPQRRAQLDEMRQRKIPIVTEQHSESLSLQGIVRRSSGRSTVWLNGQAHQDSKALAPSNSAEAKIPLGNGKSKVLKVGERLELTAPQSAGENP